MLKLKLQYFGHLMQRSDSLEKTLMLGKIEGKNRRGQKRMKWSDSITNSMDMNFSKLQERVKDREAKLTTIHGVANSQMWLSEQQQSLQKLLRSWKQSIPVWFEPQIQDQKITLAFPGFHLVGLTVSQRLLQGISLQRLSDEVPLWGVEDVTHIQ